MKLRTSVTILGLLTTAGLLGLSSLKLASKADANPLKGAVATYYSPREYHPLPKYYVPGELESYTRAQINVRTGLGTHYYAKHYGLTGDRVTILNEAWGRDGYQWWYLKFNESGAKGWVREDLVLLND